MKKLKSLLLVVSVLFLGLIVFTACNEKSRDEEPQYADTYYEYKNGVKQEGSWIKLKKYKWSDDDGASGKLEEKDGTLYGYSDNDVLFYGTVAEGVFHWTIDGNIYYDYYKDGAYIDTSTENNTTTESDYRRENDYIYFGTYPQTEVTDSAVKSALTSMAGTLPTSSNNQEWTSYGYYIESTVSNYMWYIDLNYNGEKYRGVYFTGYRPHFTTNSSSTGISNQDGNGYSTSTVYWFKYEPIKWRILSEEGGEALIFCEMIIDSQEYYPSGSASSFSHNGGTGYANNYALSNIRKWLNDTFYNTAFSEMQKEIIQLTTLDNSVRSANPNNNATAFNSGNNQYVCANTEDYIFLLSEQEITNSAYGFNADSINYDTVRRKKTTAYAQCQGAFIYPKSDYLDNGIWWLRSPDFRYSIFARLVGPEGDANTYYYHVYSSGSGVVPALKIRLS